MFESLKERYEKGWVRRDQLKKYVELTIITEAEYALITNERYERDDR
ncbi:XkdX family protein [Oceanobacillus sp. E9]|nr:XkdX family protein [Oceanobacillus sp. E9]